MSLQTQPNLLACPLDQQPLSQKDKQLVCPHGHSFDISRSGYINLLPAHFKRSKDPGDSKEMVLARRSFLETQAYSPIANSINQLAYHYLKNRSNAMHCSLDAGCGEGYYLASWKKFIDEQTETPHYCYGLDISKWAIAAAAKRDKNITWLVASNKQPPFIEESLDIIFCTFGFPCYPAFWKALKKGGIVIMSDAGQQHLIEAREILYDDIKAFQPRNVSAAVDEGFILQDKKTLQYSLNLESSEDIQRLLAMTPHMYRSKRDKREALFAKEALGITVDIYHTVLQKM